MTATEWPRARAVNPAAAPRKPRRTASQGSSRGTGLLAAPTISDPVPARQRVVDLYASALERPLGFLCEAPGAWS
jgi:hypothetical protein